MTPARAGSQSALSRLADVIAGLGDRPGTEAFVARLTLLVEEISGCHLEGFRAVSGEWFTGPGSVGADVLRMAADRGVGDSPGTEELAVSLPERPWAAAFAVSGRGEGKASIVVSAPAPFRQAPDRSGVDDLIEWAGPPRPE